MKKLLLFIFFACFSQIIQAQNLVPNPSFEEYVTCPNAYGGNNLSIGWFPFRPSPDYFNICANYSTGVSVPSNSFGYQYPASGNGYCGVGVGLASENEQLGCQLSSDLVIGTKYYFSMKISLANYSTFGYDKVGARFSTIPYCIHLDSFNNNCDSLPSAPVINYAQVYSSQIIVDTANWIKISGSFIADSAYKYLLIGEMFTNAQSQLVSGGIWDGYYYIDDVCVSHDSLTCETVGVNEISFNNSITVFPNPCSDFLQIEFPDARIFYNAEIYLYDYLGREVFAYKMNNTIKLNVKEIPNGFYFMRITTDKKTLSRKIIINH